MLDLSSSDSSLGKRFTRTITKNREQYYPTYRFEKLEYRISKSETNPNIELPKFKIQFRISEFGNLNLPFDFAQGGELVEPFRISCFGFRILSEPKIDETQQKVLRSTTVTNYSSRTMVMAPFGHTAAHIPHPLQ